jgi:hypothetical protein
VGVELSSDWLCFHFLLLDYIWIVKDKKNKQRGGIDYYHDADEELTVRSGRMS